MRILGLSASSRPGSVSVEILRACFSLLPAGVEATVGPDLSEIPLFAQGKEADSSVLAVRNLLNEAEKVLIVSPEYIHSLPAALKNLFEWTVASGEFYQKQVVVLTPFARSTYVLEQVLEILKTMEARLPDELSGWVGPKGQGETAESILANPELRARLQTVSDWLSDPKA